MATMVIMILIVTISSTSVCDDDDDYFINIDNHDDYGEYDVNEDCDIGGKASECDNDSFECVDKMT